MGRFHPLRETVEKNELFLKELFKNPSLTVILSEKAEKEMAQKKATVKKAAPVKVKWPYSSLMSVNKTDNRLK